MPSVSAGYSALSRGQGFVGLLQALGCDGDLFGVDGVVVDPRLSVGLGLEIPLALWGQPLNREVVSRQQALGLAADLAHAGERVAALVGFRGGLVPQRWKILGR